MKPTRLTLCFILVFLCFGSLKAQSDWEERLREGLEAVEELDIGLDEKEQLLEQLQGYLISPLNLNTATSSELALLGLDDFQIFSLQHYIRETGELLSLHELSVVNGFNSETINRIMPFVCARKSNWKAPLRFDSIAKASRHTLRAQYRQVLEPSKGYTREDGKGYQGERFATQLRYTLDYFERLQFSIVADNDAGEPFFSSLQPYGFDHYSIQLTLRQIGILEQLTLGDYRLNFAEGLTIGQGFSLSYLNTDAKTKKRTHGITPHRSSSEYGYNRGAAANIRLDKTNLYLFASARPNDYSGNLLTTGLHRTPHELECKDSTFSRMLGAHLCYDRKGLQIGATALYYDFSDSLHRQNRDYQRYYFEGKQNAVASINASYLFRRLLLFGETAISRNLATASILGMQYNLGYKTTLSMSFRNYDKRFQNHYASALGAQSRIANEQAVNLAFAHRINGKYSYYLGADFFRFPFATYLSSQSSGGYKIRGEFIFTPNETTRLRLLCKFNSREQDSKSDHQSLEAKQLFSSQIIFQNAFDENFSLHSRCGVSQSLLQGAGYGKFAMLEAIYTLSRFPLRLNLRYSYFDTDDYDTRFSIYEYNLPLTYSTSTLYDKGHRAYLLLRYSPNEHFLLSFRYSVTLYAEKETVSSGNDLINAHHKQDIGLQIFFKF